MSTEPRLCALRGATSVPSDDAAAIVSATTELLGAMLERNSVVPADVVSLIFTATPDLTATFPAQAARNLDLEVPLLCAQEIAVPGAIQRCVRVLMHLYSTRDYASLRHVYLGDARRLREDLLEE
ncbi:MAG: chorismate mutase [Actinomycetota bacterium]